MVRLVAFGAAMLLPVAASAQIGRDTQIHADAYARARATCGYRYEDGLRQCRPVGSCTERLDTQRTQCIAAAERSYQRALRRLMRPAY